MTLAVPIQVRVGDVDMTREVMGLSFTKNAVGGLQSLSCKIARPLTSTDQVPVFAHICLTDARTAETFAEAVLSDTGRSAGPDGQTWELTAFGPAQLVYEDTLPYVVVDTRLETFTRRGASSTKNADTTTDERSADVPSLLVKADEGKMVTTSWQGDHISRVMQQAGMKLARVRCDIDSGITNANYTLQVRPRTDGDGGTVADSATSSTTASSLTGVVVTDFPNGANQLSVMALRTTSNVTATEDHWFEFWGIVQRAMLLAADGTDVTGGYSANTVRAYEVVRDLVGRTLRTYFDDATVSIDTSATYDIDQMAYPDGVTPGQVLEDVMALEPAFRWYTGPTNESGKFTFAWEPWPTAVRYEVRLDDGGTFPASGQELYNGVVVRWTDRRGRPRTTRVTGAHPILDAAGLTRTAWLDLADEVGSAAAATRRGQNYLADHLYPANAGTLTIARPIRDLATGRMVRPHEIEPGELIRVHGVESYPDALNPSSSDGQTVFRIWSMTYSSDNDSATLELDTHSRTVANALAKLMRRRVRKR